MFKVEKVEIPSFKKTAFDRQYPFDTMKVGESFLFNHYHYPHCKSAGHHHGRRHGMTFRFKKQNEFETRCYRIA